MKWIKTVLSVQFSVYQDKIKASRELQKSEFLFAIFPQRLQQTIYLNLPKEPKEVMQVLYTLLKLHWFKEALYF